jgi:hypothetical protein
MPINEKVTTTQLTIHAVNYGEGGGPKLRPSVPSPWQHRKSVWGRLTRISFTYELLIPFGLHNPSGLHCCMVVEFPSSYCSSCLSFQTKLFQCRVHGAICCAAQKCDMRSYFIQCGACIPEALHEAGIVMACQCPGTGVMPSFCPTLLRSGVSISAILHFHNIDFSAFYVSFVRVPAIIRMSGLYLSHLLFSFALGFCLLPFVYTHSGIVVANDTLEVGAGYNDASGARPMPYMAMSAPLPPLSSAFNLLSTVYALRQYVVRCTSHSCAGSHSWNGVPHRVSRTGDSLL